MAYWLRRWSPDRACPGSIPVPGPALVLENGSSRLCFVSARLPDQKETANSNKIEKCELSLHSKCSFLCYFTVSYDTGQKNSVCLQSSI